MFEITRTLDDRALNSVAYHVYLRFFERDRFFGHGERVERMRAIMEPHALPLIPEVETIVGEIEQDSGMPLESMTEEQLSVYVREIERITRDRRPPSTPETIARAERALEEIRREFGYAA